MYSILIYSMMVNSLMMYKSKNPIKICWKLMIYMKTFCLILFMVSMKSFFPLVMVMVMVGGLLIMYMIMSTMLPNNPMKTSKMSKFEKSFLLMMLLSTYLILCVSKSMETQQYYLMPMISTTKTYYFTLIMIILYLFSITMMMESEDTSLRSYS